MMIQEGHILTLPEPVCGSDKWTVLNFQERERGGYVSLWYVTLACELSTGERREIGMDEDRGWLKRVRRGEVTAPLHTSERHVLTVALEGLLRARGIDAKFQRVKGDLVLPTERKPSKSGLAPWEVLQRLDDWALTVQELRVTSMGDLQRSFKFCGRDMWLSLRGARWLMWERGEPTVEVEQEQLFDRVIELVRSMRSGPRVKEPEA